MKQLLALCFGVLLTLAGPARAARAFVNPPDSVAGEARLTNLIALGICEQVAMESRQQDITLLNRAQGMGLLQGMLTKVVARLAPEFTAFAAAAPAAEVDGALQRVTIQAMLRLSSVCPATSQLLNQLGGQMAGLDDKLSAAQQQAVEAMAQDMCGQLTAEDAQKAFSRRTAPERIAANQQVRHGTVLTHGRTLVAAFGEELLTNEPLESNMWENVDRMMFNICPVITAQLRVDQGFAKLKGQSGAAPASAAKSPARQERKK